MNRPHTIALTFVEEGVTVHAQLLWDLAPQTCEAVLQCLPAYGQSHHGIYSGSECVLLLDQIPRIGPENATSQVKPGEVAFVWMAAGAAYGVERDFAEICWFYDIDAEPRMWGGTVDVNVFAEITGDPAEFFAVCRRMRREGIKPLRVEALSA